MSWFYSESGNIFQGLNEHVNVFNFSPQRDLFMDSASGLTSAHKSLSKLIAVKKMRLRAEKRRDAALLRMHSPMRVMELCESSSTSRFSAPFKPWMDVSLLWFSLRTRRLFRVSQSMKEISLSCEKKSFRTNTSLNCNYCFLKQGCPNFIWK